MLDLLCLRLAWAVHAAGHGTSKLRQALQLFIWTLLQRAAHMGPNKAGHEQSTTNPVEPVHCPACRQMELLAADWPQALLDFPVRAWWCADTDLHSMQDMHETSA